MQELVDPAALEGMIEDTEGVSVVSGGTQTFGHLEEPHEALLPDGEVLTVDRAVVVAYGILPALEIGDPITVGGEAYVVRDRRRLRDGALMAIALGAP